MFSSSSRNHRLFITDEVVTFALKIIAAGCWWWCESVKRARSMRSLAPKLLQST